MRQCRLTALRATAGFVVLLSMSTLLVSYVVVDDDSAAKHGVCRVPTFKEKIKKKVMKLGSDLRRLARATDEVLFMDERASSLEDQVRRFEMSEGKRETGQWFDKLIRWWAAGTIEEEEAKKQGTDSLRVVIKSAQARKDTDWVIGALDNKADPYVECQLISVPEKQHMSTTISRTAAVSNMLNPIWTANEHNTFIMQGFKVNGFQLYCEVFDKDHNDPVSDPKVFKAVRSLGSVTLDENALGENINAVAHDVALGPQQDKYSKLQLTTQICRESHCTDSDSAVEEHNECDAKADYATCGICQGDAPTCIARPGHKCMSGKCLPQAFFWGCGDDEVRVRKDWNDLTDAERGLYLEAVNTIKDTPLAYGTGNIYDGFVRIHGETANKAYAHQTAGFLAWHRKFLLEYETALRTVDERFKCVTLPYWDWSAEMFECKVTQGGAGFGNAPCDTYHAASKFLRDFGGPGDENHRSNTHGSSGVGKVGCVTTGPFKDWIDHNGKCLSRGVNWKIQDQEPFTGRVRLMEIIEHENFGGQDGRQNAGFRLVLEGTPHGMTHNYLGGHMRSFISPADPIFFSHHAFIDKVWAAWQDCHDYDEKAVKDQLMAQGAGEDPNLFKYHQPTGFEHQPSGGGDKVDDNMLFRMPLGTALDQSSNKCVKDGANGFTPCGHCIHKEDSWCASNAWDGQCKAMCSDPQCADVCSSGLPEVVSMHTKGKQYFPHWDESETTPATMASTLYLKDRSYVYAPDEFERHLAKSESPVLEKCNLHEFKGGKLVKKAQAAKSGGFGGLLELHRFHHEAGTTRTEAARAWTDITTDAFSKTGLTRKEAYAEMQAEECKALACDKPYNEVYNCESNNARFWLKWVGHSTWTQIMNDKKAQNDVLRSPCCALLDGDDLKQRLTAVADLAADDVSATSRFD